MTRVTKMGKKKYLEATGWEKMKSGEKERNKSQYEKRLELKKKGIKQKRQKFKGKDRHKICLFCRKKGHTLANCQERIKVEGDSNSNTQKTGICFRCGSTEHNLKNCKVVVKEGENPLPFAVCYVCNEKGHLASQCPKNERGLYPNGGCCKYCGSVRHLARDCKPANKKDDEPIELGLISDSTKGGADDDDVFTALKKIQDEKEMKKQQKTMMGDKKPSVQKKKVVTF